MADPVPILLVGCGRMGSTIDDEQVGDPCYPWPWAHAPAMIEARGIELVAGVDSDPAKLDDFKGKFCNFYKIFLPTKFF